MKEPAGLLKNLVPGAGYLKATIKEGVVVHTRKDRGY